MYDDICTCEVEDDSNFAKDRSGRDVSISDRWRGHNQEPAKSDAMEEILTREMIYQIQSRKFQLSSLVRRFLGRIEIILRWVRADWRIPLPWIVRQPRVSGVDEEEHKSSIKEQEPNDVADQLSNIMSLRGHKIMIKMKKTPFKMQYLIG